VPADTLGCILVGRNWQPGDEKITASRLSFASLLAKIPDTVKRGDRVLLRVIQESAPQELAARVVKLTSKPVARSKAGSRRKPGKTALPKRDAKRTKSTKKAPARKT
jgi:hypothetical protein